MSQVFCTHCQQEDIVCQQLFCPPEELLVNITLTLLSTFCDEIQPDFPACHREFCTSRVTKRSVRSADSSYVNGQYECQASLVWSGVAGMDKWCKANCVNGNDVLVCTEEFCDCTQQTTTTTMKPTAADPAQPATCTEWEANSIYSGTAGMDSWCQSVCSGGRCPQSHCQCKVKTTTTGIPTTTTEMPTTTTEMPTTTTTSTEIPITSTEMPTTSTEMPPTSTEMPTTTSTEIPITSTEMPTTSTDIPTTTTEMPTTTSTEIPITSTEMPTTSTEIPTTTTEMPTTTSTEIPITSTEMPTTTTEMPTTTTEMPTTTSTEIPITSTEMPTTSTEMPTTTTASTEMPTSSTSAEMPTKTTSTEMPTISSEMPTTKTNTTTYSSTISTSTVSTTAPVSRNVTDTDSLQVVDAIVCDHALVQGHNTIEKRFCLGQGQNEGINMKSGYSDDIVGQVLSFAPKILCSLTDGTPRTDACNNMFCGETPLSQRMIRSVLCYVCQTLIVSGASMCSNTYC